MNHIVSMLRTNRLYIEILNVVKIGKRVVFLAAEDAEDTENQVFIKLCDLCVLSGS